MQLPFGMGGSAVLMDLATWCRRYGSAINHCRSVVIRIALVLIILLLFGAGRLGMRTAVNTEL